jgi:hypothetical protein
MAGDKIVLFKVSVWSMEGTIQIFCRKIWTAMQWCPLGCRRTGRPCYISNEGTKANEGRCLYEEEVENTERWNLTGGTLRGGKTIIENKKSERKRGLWNYRRRLVEDIIVHFKRTMRENADWTHLVQHTDLWRCLSKTVMKLSVL